MEYCANCHREIGALETPHVFNDQVVCARCAETLRPRISYSSSLPPPVVHRFDVARLTCSVALVAAGVSMLLAGLIVGASAIVGTNSYINLYRSVNAVSHDLPAETQSQVSDVDSAASGIFWMTFGILAVVCVMFVGYGLTYLKCIPGVKASRISTAVVALIVALSQLLIGGCATYGFLRMGGLNILSLVGIYLILVLVALAGALIWFIVESIKRIREGAVEVRLAD